MRRNSLAIFLNRGIRLLFKNVVIELKEDGPTHTEGTNGYHCPFPASTYPFLERAGVADWLALHPLIIGCSKGTGAIWNE